MVTLLHSSIGGTVESTGDRQVTCRYPGTVVSLLLASVVLVWAAGSVAMAAGAVLDHEPKLLAGVFVGLVACAALVVLIRRRLRLMGWFVIDRDRGTLTHYRGQRDKGHWPLAEITFESRWDPFYRGFGLAYWLTARVPDGRGLRLAKGPRDEMLRLQQHLARMAAPPGG